MGEGLVKPYEKAMLGRAKTIEDAVDLPPIVAVAPEPVMPSAPKMSVTEAQAKADKYKADREAFAATTKGMPKPGLLDRLKRLVQ